jgi:hypothetical protein
LAVAVFLKRVLLLLPPQGLELRVAEDLDLLVRQGALDSVRVVAQTIVVVVLFALVLLRGPVGG